MRRCSLLQHRCSDKWDRCVSYSHWNHLYCSFDSLRANLADWECAVSQCQQHLLLAAQPRGCELEGASVSACWTAARTKGWVDVKDWTVRKQIQINKNEQVLRPNIAFLCLAGISERGASLRGQDWTLAVGWGARGRGFEAFVLSALNSCNAMRATHLDPTYTHTAEDLIYLFCVFLRQHKDAFIYFDSDNESVFKNPNLSPPDTHRPKYR